MYKINDEKSEKTYIELMDSIKKLNSDWIKIRNSKGYKIGSSLVELKDALKSFKISEVRKILNRKKQGLRKKQVISLKENTHDVNYFSNDRIVIYTSIFGKYDSLIEPLCVPDNCDYVIITDLNVDENSKWKKMDTLPEMKNMTNVEKNRYAKMNPHLFFKDYKYSIYIDGNIQVISDLTEYVNILNEIGIGIHTHHLRDCVYDELNVLLKSKKDTKENLLRHKKYLIDTGMPKNYGLLQCNLIVREHNNETCIKIMQDWWNEFENYSKRDQVSLPHVLYKNNIKIEKVGILGNNVYNNPSFRILTHK